MELLEVNEIKKPSQKKTITKNKYMVFNFIFDRRLLKMILLIEFFLYGLEN